METQVNFPPKVIHQIANLMATQNPSDPNYMKGPDLVNLFNALGYIDAYTFSDGRGIQTIDYGEGLSRLTYVTKRLQDLNKSYQIPNAVQEFTNRIQEPLEFINSMQKVLEPFKLSQFIPKSPSATALIKDKEAESKKDDASNVADEEVVAMSKVDAKKVDERRKSLEESVLGEIQEGHPVVFISYSWDSQSHKEWVAKLAKDLFDNGIIVLLDQYLEGGTSLPIFMDLGISRADKVLVIGTPSYRNKCLGISSGVAFEESIIRGTMFQNIGTKKFLPCLRVGEFEKSFPLILFGGKGYDFRKDEDYLQTLDDLCRDIYGRPRLARPKLGDIPDYAK